MSEARGKPHNWPQDPRMAARPKRPRRPAELRQPAASGPVSNLLDRLERLEQALQVIAQRRRDAHRWK